MPIGNLLQSQTNAVYLAVKEAGWNMSEFEWLMDGGLIFGGNQSPKLRHKPSNFFFIFEFHQKNKFHFSYSPGSQRTVETKEAGSWSSVLSSVKTWLSYLAREVNSPDLWAELPTDSKLIESASEEENSKFTAKEKKIVVNGIEEIKQYLITSHQLDPELIEGQLKYLVESADRLGRKDWKNILVATIFSIIIQGGIAGHTAQEIFQFVWTVLSAVLIQKLYLP